jgi:Ala-tRNA(Pro) deacylase
LLLDLLARAGVTFRLIYHAPEGRTDVVSVLRGNALEQAAKCIVVTVRVDKKTTRHVLAVVPGDRRVRIDEIKRIYGARYAAFATLETAELLAGSVSGSIVPFTFHDDLELIVDEDLLAHDEIYFNAARLDVSMVLATDDYLALAGASVASISEPRALAATA